MKYALLGDFIGSSYEFKDGEKIHGSLEVKSSSTITDDSILLFATAQAVINNMDFSERYSHWYNKYPDIGFGQGFIQWAKNPHMIGTSYGNGAASRASIIGKILNSETEVLEKSKQSAYCSHNHPEGIAGAQASALAVFLAKENTKFEEVQLKMYEMFEYAIMYSLDHLHREKAKDTSAINTVPVAIYIGFNCETLDQCIKNCIYVGGDVDTIMSIALAIASERLPDKKEKDSLQNHMFKLDRHLRDLGDSEMHDILLEFKNIMEDKESP